MKKYDYLVQQIAMADEVKVLNMLGANGWKLIHIFQEQRNSIAKSYYFIREISNG